MKFLAVLLIVTLYRNWLGNNPVRDSLPFDGYADWCRRLSFQAHIRYLIAVGLPTALVFWLATQLQHGWILNIIWLVLALAVLIYAVEMRDNDLVFDQQEDWLDSLLFDTDSEDTPTSASSVGSEAASDGEDTGEGADDDEYEEDEYPTSGFDEVGEDRSVSGVMARQKEFQQCMIYDIFQSLHPVVLWFLVLGPAGTLLYILTTMYEDGIEEDDVEAPLVRQVVFWMELPAARLTTLLFALVGNFGSAMSRWLEGALDFSRHNDEFLADVADAAVPTLTPDTIESFVRVHKDRNPELRILMERSLYGWVGLAAIVAIAGW